MRAPSTIALAFALLTAGAAMAQAPEGTPTRIRGTIDRVEGQTMVVNSRDGQKLSIALAPNLTVVGVVKRSLADIKSGDYLASSSMRGTDGKLHALEIHFLPATATEGQFPWDLQPDSVMTNAFVTGIAAAPKGQMLTVTHKGAQSEVVVDAETPIVGYVNADASLLKPGAAIFTVAQKKADGSMSTARITAEKDGVKPPM